jgi:hypothetical protein
MLGQNSEFEVQATAIHQRIFNQGANMTNQLREAAERWKTFSSNDYDDSDFSREDDAEILATYAAEQLAGDGGGREWVGIDEAEKWPEGTHWVAIEFLDGDPECSYLHFEHDLDELRAMGSNWSHLFYRLPTTTSEANR